MTPRVKAVLVLLGLISLLFIAPPTSFGNGFLRVALPFALAFWLAPLLGRLVRRT